MQTKRILNGTNARAGGETAAREEADRGDRSLGPVWGGRFTDEAHLTACTRVYSAYERAREVRR